MNLIKKLESLPDQVITVRLFWWWSIEFLYSSHTLIIDSCATLITLSLWMMWYYIWNPLHNNNIIKKQQQIKDVATSHIFVQYNVLSVSCKSLLREMLQFYTLTSSWKDIWFSFWISVCHQMRQPHHIVWCRDIFFLVFDVITSIKLKRWLHFLKNVL